MSTTESEGKLPTMTEVLTRLAELQAETAPIHITIGGVNRDNIVERDVIYVQEAPPRVVNVAVSEFVYVSVDGRGLRIKCRKPVTE